MEIKKEIQNIRTQNKKLNEIYFNNETESSNISSIKFTKTKIITNNIKNLNENFSFSDKNNFQIENSSTNNLNEPNLQNNLQIKKNMEIVKKKEFNINKYQILTKKALIYKSQSNSPKIKNYERNINNNINYYNYNNLANVSNTSGIINISNNNNPDNNALNNATIIQKYLTIEENPNQIIFEKDNIKNKSENSSPKKPHENESIYINNNTESNKIISPSLIEENQNLNNNSNLIQNSNNKFKDINLNYNKKNIKHNIFTYQNKIKHKNYNNEENKNINSKNFINFDPQKENLYFSDKIKQKDGFLDIGISETFISEKKNSFNIFNSNKNLKSTNNIFNKNRHKKNKSVGEIIINSKNNLNKNKKSKSSNNIFIQEQNLKLLKNKKITQTINIIFRKKDSKDIVKIITSIMRKEKGGVVDFAIPDLKKKNEFVFKKNSKFNYSSLKYLKSAKIIQAWWRNIVKLYKKVSKKIIKIQSFFRGFLLRKRIKNELENIKKEKEKKLNENNNNNNNKVIKIIKHSDFNNNSLILEANRIEFLSTFNSFEEINFLKNKLKNLSTIIINKTIHENYLKHFYYLIKNILLKINKNNLKQKFLNYIFFNKEKLNSFLLKEKLLKWKNQINLNKINEIEEKLLNSFNENNLIKNNLEEINEKLKNENEEKINDYNNFSNKILLLTLEKIINNKINIKKSDFLNKLILNKNNFDNKILLEKQNKNLNSFIEKLNYNKNLIIEKQISLNFTNSNENKILNYKNIKFNNDNLKIDSFNISPSKINKNQNKKNIIIKGIFKTNLLKFPFQQIYKEMKRRTLIKAFRNISSLQLPELFYSFYKIKKYSSVKNEVMIACAKLIQQNWREYLIKKKNGLINENYVIKQDKNYISKVIGENFVNSSSVIRNNIISNKNFYELNQNRENRQYVSTVIGENFVNCNNYNNINNNINNIENYSFNRNSNFNANNLLNNNLNFNTSTNYLSTNNFLDNNLNFTNNIKRNEFGNSSSSFYKNNNKSNNYNYSRGNYSIKSNYSVSNNLNNDFRNNYNNNSNSKTNKFSNFNYESSYNYLNDEVNYNNINNNNNHYYSNKKTYYRNIKHLFEDFYKRKFLKNIIELFYINSY